MSVTIPDFMPELSPGFSEDPAEGGCVMQVTNYLYDGGFGDHPECTDGMLAEIAITINDGIDKGPRRILYLAVPDLIGTAWLAEDLAPKEEASAVAAMQEWVEQTGPFEIDDACDPCESEDGWVCLGGRISMAVGMQVNNIECNPDEDEVEGEQRQLATWFVAFVRKYRELFGAPAEPIVEAQWQSAAEYLTPA